MDYVLQIVYLFINVLIFAIFARSLISWFPIDREGFVVQTLDDLMDRHRFDVLDFPEFGGEGIAYQLDRTCWNWVPVVVHLHGSVAMFAEHTGWPEPPTRFYRYGTFVEELSIKEADGLIASSSGHADLVSRRYGIPREDIDVVLCGVDAELFSPPPGGSALPARPTILFVGSVVENKGVHILVEAALR